MTKAALLLLPLLVCSAACDAEPELADESTVAERLVAAPNPPLDPWHGRWEGPMDMVDFGAEYDYEATIAAMPGLCWIDGVERLSAQWDYFRLGDVCTSELEFVGVSTALSGVNTYTFLDHHRTGPCLDGVVDLVETADPAVMHHTWRHNLSSSRIVGEGDVTFSGLCGPGFASGEGDGGGDGGT